MQQILCYVFVVMFNELKLSWVCSCIQQIKTILAMIQLFYCDKKIELLSCKKDTKKLDE